MRRIAPFARLAVILLVAAALVQCASTKKQKAEVTEPVEPLPPTLAAMPEVSLDQLRQEVERYMREQLGPGGMQTAQRGSPGEESWSGRSAARKLFRKQMREFMRRLFEQLTARIDHDFGMPESLQLETIALEALDERGNAIEVSLPIETRKLRSLTAPSYRTPMLSLLGEEDLTLALYSIVPTPIAPADSEQFFRLYTGEEASAIGMEAKLVVTLKGGEWKETDGSKPVANTIAIRGLDIERGLRPNTNKRYDDTMFVVVEDVTGEIEAYEYRMTTESSSAARGVGRLDARQVTYVRGLHRGKDPAYKLKTGSAEGTRQEMEGTYKITGANIHSAYSRRPITSETPLKENVSLGCQVVAASKSDFEKSFVRTLDQKGVKEFLYTIVDEEEMVFLDESLRQKGRQSILVHAVTRGA